MRGTTCRRIADGAGVRGTAFAGVAAVFTILRCDGIPAFSVNFDNAGGVRGGARLRYTIYFLPQSAKILSLARMASVTLVSVGLQAVEVGMIPLPPK